MNNYPELDRDPFFLQNKVDRIGSFILDRDVPTYFNHKADLYFYQNSPEGQKLAEKCYDYFREWYIVFNVSITHYEMPWCEKVRYIFKFNYQPIIKGWYEECLEAWIENCLT